MVGMCERLKHMSALVRPCEHFRSETETEIFEASCLSSRDFLLCFFFPESTRFIIIVFCQFIAYEYHAGYTGGLHVTVRAHIRVRRRPR